MQRSATSMGLVIGLVLIALALGGFLGWQLMPSAGDEAGGAGPQASVAPPATETAEGPAQEEATSENQDVTQVPEDTAEAEAGPEAAADLSEDAAEPAQDAPLERPDLPTFDVVRIEPDGNAIIAGRAAARSQVTVLISGVVLEEVTADQLNGFAVLTEIPPSDQPRQLSLEMRVDGFEEVFRSEETVLVAPTPTPAPAPATAAESSVDVASVDEEAFDEDETLPVVPPAAPTDDQPASQDVAENAPADTGVDVAAAAPTPTETDVLDETTSSRTSDPAAETQAETTEASPSADTESVEVADAPEVPEAPALPEETAAADVSSQPQLLVSNEEGVSVLSSTPPEALSSIALDTISYDQAGEVVLGGRAPGEGFVRIYLDDQPITTSRIAADGNWRTELPEIDTGVYRLRVDEVAADGSVTSRIETPFLREDTETVQTALAELAPEGEDLAFKTVQPGATLWAIARERYGEGQLYVKVFEANKDQIRDPDLIFPGQVFNLPE